MNKKLNHGSLFSGIGGFDLAAEWMGWNNVFHCEINPFGQKVLQYYWPESELFTDITKTDFTKYYGTVDIISGGFPCQPFSLAGKRQGTEDDRNLWPEMLRVIREVKPRWIVGENVPGIINWSEGLVFEQVQADLENEGYEVQPVILPACSVNASHRRERTWFVAHSNLSGCKQSNKEMEGGTTKQSNGLRIQQDAANTSSQRLQRGEHLRGIKKEREKSFNKQSFGSFCSFNKEYTFESPVCCGNDGFPGELDGITFSKWRTESIKAYGNAIVPQVVYQIFKAINQYEQTLLTK